MKRAELFVIAVVLGALLPFVVHAQDLRADATNALLFLIAASGLNVAVGFAGQPSLGQGAFVGIGAYGTAILRAHAGLGPVPATLAAVAAAGVAGVIVARGVAPLRAAFVALTTWVLAWTLSVAINAFPSLSGGAQGIVLAPLRVDIHMVGIAFTLGPVGLYETALVICALTLLVAHRSVVRYGSALAAIREDPRAAAAAGIDVAALRARALVMSAVLGGAAGAMLVQTAGVADPTSYGPLLSLKLFLVVLVGGAGSIEGPIVGLAVLLAVSRIAGSLSSVVGGESVRAEAITTAAVLMFVLAVARKGLAPLVRDRFVRSRRGSAAEPASISFAPIAGARMTIRNATVEFGGVVALDDVSLTVEPSTTHAIVGPNGSGKSTLLRVCAGVLRAGTVDTTGVVRRTLQRLAIAPELTAAEHLVGGTEPRRVTGLVRAITATPGSRAERREVEEEARALCARAGIDPAARAAGLSVGERRLVQILRALASHPQILLLDEPSAGMDAPSERRLVELLRALQQAGLTIVIVEHNLALVRAIAGRVTVLDAGRVLADGPPDEVARDPLVQAAYLGVP
ncbi:MAG: ATP-binding cassette domain-containing protein [Actinomycetota bacterium]